MGFTERVDPKDPFWAERTKTLKKRNLNSNTYRISKKDEKNFKFLCLGEFLIDSDRQPIVVKWRSFRTYLNYFSLMYIISSIGSTILWKFCQNNSIFTELPQMKVVLEKKGIEGENAFFQIWLFFLTFDTKHDNDKWSQSFCGDKKTFFFFRSFFWKNISTKWRCPDRPFCDYFSEEKPPTLWSMKKIIFLQNNSKDAQLQILSCTFDKSFLFWTNEKKKWAHKRKFSPSRQRWCKN